jgi:branched-chain amino acid aminotransferase
LFLYLNDQFISTSNARIAPDDRGFLLGDGLFETMKSTQGSIHFFKQHWQRLQNGCQFLAIPVPLSDKTLQTIISELLIKNNLHETSAGIRLTLTRGSSSRGLLPPENPQPTFMLTCFSLAPIKKSVSLHVTKIIRNEHSPLVKIKSLNYLDNILARREAFIHHTDEGILLNTKGNIAEVSAANIFMVKDNKVFTPSIEEGALPGVTRQIVIDICKKLSIPILETAIDLSFFYSAQEIFLTNSLIGIQPVHRVNDQSFSMGNEGVVFKLQQAYAAILDKKSRKA